MGVLKTTITTKHKQNRNKLTGAEKQLIVARGEGVEGLHEKNGGIKKHKLVVPK